MNNPVYTDLLRSIALLRNLDDADSESLQMTGGMWVEDVYFYLLEDEDPELDAVCVYCVFGMAPPEKEAEVLRAILQENAAMFLYSGPSFMINAQDGNVLLSHRYSLSVTTPEDLLNVIESLAVEALKWRESFYLDEIQTDTAPDQPSLHHNFV